MARLIDGDDLIAWIKGSQQMTSKMKNIICYIKTIPTLDAVSDWIPCSERMPSEETSVLVTFGYGEIGIDLHTVGWANNGWVWHDDVIAWMPLPKPYGESEK